jgi:peptidoglycan biosynthesis protein MviN/MurJ (putative lipid II flippase)
MSIFSEEKTEKKKYTSTSSCHVLVSVCLCVCVCGQLFFPFIITIIQYTSTEHDTANLRDLVDFTSYFMWWRNTVLTAREDQKL